LDSRAYTVPGYDQIFDANFISKVIAWVFNKISAQESYPTKPSAFSSSVDSGSVEQLFRLPSTVYSKHGDHLSHRPTEIIVSTGERHVSPTQKILFLPVELEKSALLPLPMVVSCKQPNVKKMMNKTKKNK
ncbi:conserved hypothetical protein, partial [Trichinella spiralis]|uniref:hypothetical protein n=1 Tax=Trichinella spiralis TaxID=6334 RepID=UPI0001EFE074